MTSLPTWLPLLLDFYKLDLFVKTVLSRQFFFSGGGGGSSYMIPQNRVGIGGLFFISLLQNPPICPKKVHTKIQAPKKNCEGTFSNKIILYFFLEIVIKNLGSGIQMVGKPKILADNPKCRAWLSAG